MSTEEAPMTLEQRDALRESSRFLEDRKYAQELKATVAKLNDLMRIQRHGVTTNLTLDGRPVEGELQVSIVKVLA